MKNIDVLPTKKIIIYSSKFQAMYVILPCIFQLLNVQVLIWDYHNDCDNIYIIISFVLGTFRSQFWVCWITQDTRTFWR